MKIITFVLVAVCFFAINTVAQDNQKSASDSWRVHGFVEEQYRPTQDFSATSLWLTAKKENRSVGLFNFSQIANPAIPTKISYWESYAGLYAAKPTKAGFVEGGVAIGAESGGHIRFAGYGFFAPKKAAGITVFAIHEHGTYEGSGWTRVHIQKPVTKSLKLGYHHQTYSGDGINVDWKIGKSPFSFFGVVARDHGKTKTMAALRFNF